MCKFVKNKIVKKVYQFILFSTVMLLCSDFVHAQLTSSDFQYTASISDSLGAPARMAIDNNDNIFVVDSYHKDIKKYDPSGNWVETISTGGSPLSLAVNSNNVLFIGDGQSGNILKLNSNGTTSVFYTGAVFPNSISFSPDNHLYIADSKLKRILVLDASGTLVQTIGDGTLVFPTGIAYDRKNNRIIVGEHGAMEDNLQTRVYIYDLAGNIINQIGYYGSGDGMFYRVQGVTVGRCGNIYVCEPFQGNVSVFDENGTFITKFGQFGTGVGQLNVLMDVVFNSQEKVILASMNNASLELFTITDSLPSASVQSELVYICEGDSADISIKFTGIAPWSFTYTQNDQNPVTLNNITSNPYHLTVSQEGIYKVIALSDATTAGYCFSGSSKVIVIISAVPDFTYTENTLSLSFVSTIQNATSYFWDFGDNTTSNLPNPVHDFLAPGVYTVTLTTENQGCFKTVVKTITVGNPSSILTNPGIGGMKINISPNPSDGIFTLDIIDAIQPDISIEIMSITSQLIFKKPVVFPGNSSGKHFYSTQIDLSHFSNGIYIVKVISHEAIKTNKLVLNKDK